MKLVLIGGYPKGYDEAFHIKTTSGRILRKIVFELALDPIYFDLWNSKEEEDSRKVDEKVVRTLRQYESKGYTLISLGRYIEKALLDNNINSKFLPHPASRDRKYIDILKSGLESYIQTIPKNKTIH